MTLSRRSALLLLGSGCAAFGQNRQERGKKIVNDAVAALGGNAYLKMKDRVETGRAYSFYREQLTGLSIARIYTKYSPKWKPLGVRERETFGKKEDNIVLLLDERGYRLTYRGARPLPPDRYERYVETTRRNILYILRQRLEEPGLIIEWKSSGVSDNVPVELVDITDSENRVVSVAFHQSTKLPVRQVFSHTDPETKDRTEEVTVYNKFRDAGGGVQWPMNVSRERNGEKIFEIFSESVEVNQDLADDLFELPQGMKLLPLR